MSLPIRLLVIIAAAALVNPSFAADPDWSQVGKALGKGGSPWPGGVYRVGLPRTDLKVSLDGLALKPGFALGGWVAFEPMGNQAMVMGDVVLTQDEVNPVMKKLEEGGIEITALHNHLLRAEPMTLYMHVLGQGDPVKLAAALHAGLALSKTPMEDAASGSSQPKPPRRKSSSTRRLSTRPWVIRARPMEASISSVSRALNRSRKTGWKCPMQWARP